MKISKLQNIKKEQIVVAFLIGLLLLVITIPTKESAKKQTTESSGNENLKDEEEQAEALKDYFSAEEKYVSHMEAELKSCLEQMEGVGRVQVMITLSSSSEQELAKDRTSEASETTVFSEEDNNMTPYVIKELSPAVKGVFVVAEGGDDPVIIQKISEAVMALFHLESHKIMVVKMKQGK